MAADVASDVNSEQAVNYLFVFFQSFPEPLFFNKETGGFEILTDAKKKMVSQIKTAVRSSQKPSKIYKPVKNHSFSDIPLIPMEDGPLTEECEIDTSFMVTVSVSCCLCDSDTSLIALLREHLNQELRSWLVRVNIS